MAVLTPLTTTTPNNKRSGVTFYSSVLAPNTGVGPPTYKLMARSTAVPIQPATLIQVVAQNVLATIALAWSKMSPGQQDLWVDGYNSLAGYTYFIAVNTYWVTWGLSPLITPAGYALFSGNLFVNSSWAGGTNPYYVTIETAGAYPLNGYYAALYLQVSSLIPSYGSGLSGTSGAGVAPPSGFVYIGYVGPTTDLTVLTVDITDVILTLYGQYPMATVSQPDMFRFWGSGLELQVVLTDGIENQWFAEYVEEPSPTPSYWIIPFTFGDPTIPSSTAAAPRAKPPRKRLKASAARFYPAARLWARLDRTRRERGLPAIGREGYRAGLPTA